METTNTNPKASETATPIPSYELYEFRKWQADQKAQTEAAAEKAKADKQEADRSERDRRIAEAVYAHQCKRTKRAVSRGTTAALVLGAIVAGLAFIAVMGGDTLEEK